MLCVYDALCHEFVIIELVAHMYYVCMLVLHYVMWFL